MVTFITSPTLGKIAIIIKANDVVSSTTFFSDPLDELQLGLIATNQLRGIPKHKHLSYERKLNQTSEFLLIRNGSCKINLWGTLDEDVQSFVLNKGDGILLLGGIHSIDSQSDQLQILEVKQGPYAGSLDKEILE